MESEVIAQKEIVVLKQQTTKAHNRAVEIKIESQEDLVKATDLLGNIKKAAKIVKTKKEAITKPINLALKNIRALFAPLEDSLTESEGLVKKEMVSFQQKVEQEAAAEARRIEAELAEKVAKEKMNEKEEMAATNEAIEKIQEIKTVENQVEGKKGTIQYRTIKLVEIVDLEKLPREYMVPDMVKIRRVALAGVEVPGVEIKEQKTVAGIL